MLTLYRASGEELPFNPGDQPSDVVWIDLLNPSEEERTQAERLTGRKLPSQEALSEIEESSRLSIDHDILFLSSPVLSQNAASEGRLSPAGFILTENMLVTTRYISLPSFDGVVSALSADGKTKRSTSIFASLLEGLVDRGADALEHIGAAIDDISRTVFKGKFDDPRHPGRATLTLRHTLSKIGALGDRLSQVRDVLLGIGRIASFSSDSGFDWVTKKDKDRLSAVSKDVRSLSDYEAHLSGKIQFLLDAVLGYINIEQNDIFKVLTIASVVGVPPTLLAGIWGMNFKVMPELSWIWGYPMAWGLIILSGLLPLLWFWRKGWF